jgi:hypothetical protein
VSEDGASVTFVLPMPPNISNGPHGHWMQRYKGHERYLEHCDWLVVAKRNPLPPRSPLTRFTIRSVMYLGHAMDDDNAMRRHKWPLDWLKTRGYIADDCKACMTWEGLPTQVVKRSADYRIDLTVTPVEAP